LTDPYVHQGNMLKSQIEMLRKTGIVDKFLAKLFDMFNKKIERIQKRPMPKEPSMKDFTIESTNKILA
jgi:hypothetical protein